MYLIATADVSSDPGMMLQLCSETEVLTGEIAHST